MVFRKNTNGFPKETKEKDLCDARETPIGPLTLTCDDIREASNISAKLSVQTHCGTWETGPTMLQSLWLLGRTFSGPNGYPRGSLYVYPRCKETICAKKIPSKNTVRCCNLRKHDIRDAMFFVFGIRDARETTVGHLIAACDNSSRVTEKESF